MKNININAIFYGFLAAFVPVVILAFLDLEISFIKYCLMVLGGYVTAKYAPRFEIINTIMLGLIACASSLLKIGIIYSTTEQSFEMTSLIYEIIISIIFFLSSPILGGALRIFEVKYRLTKK